MLRMFIAVKVAQSLREAVSGLIDGLRSSGGDVKWVKPENLHLTLKFLGNVDEARVDEIEKAVSRASDETAPFEISLSGVGAFPAPKRPRVIWVGVLEGKDTLVSLSERIEDRLAVIGFEKEKRGFSPHLTVGRLRRGGRPGDLPDRLGVQFDTAACTVQRIYLMKSTLTPRGPIYEELRQVVLEEKD
jgi:2'-5' RNA ligase